MAEPSEWMVSSQHLDGKRQYIAYRMKDRTGVDHSGNREYYGRYSPDRAAVAELVRQLNAGEVRA